MALVAEKQIPTTELQTTEHLLGRHLSCESFILTGDGSDTTVDLLTKLKVVLILLFAPVNSGGTPFTGRVLTTYATGDPDANGVYTLPVVSSAAIGNGEKVRVMLFGTT